MRNFIALVCCVLVIPALAKEEEPREDIFLSTPEEVATLTSEPSYLIGGIISPLSGQPVLRQTDLVVKGAQNVVLSRTYIPPYMPCMFPKHKHDQAEHDKNFLYCHLRDNYKGWQFYPHLRLQLDSFRMKVRLSEPNGMALEFYISNQGLLTAMLTSDPYAISNVAGDEPSGKYDLRNTRISYEENGNKITVQTADGITRIYRNKKRTAVTSYLYLLEKEILSNGKVLRYHHEGEHLRCVESLDPKERYVYSSLRVEGTPRGGHYHITSSSGLTVDYNYAVRRIRCEFKEKKHGRKTVLKFNFDCPPILTSVSSPSYRHESLDYCGRFLLGSFSGKEEVFNIFNGEFGDGAKHYRAYQLLLPVGQNDAFVPVYGLSYHPAIAGQREGATTVRNSDGTAVVYHFSKNLLTTLIQYFGQDGALKKEKAFFWNERNWLNSLEMRDGHQNLLYRKSYGYDQFGNPVLETFTGDLTGEGSQETFTTKRIFSEDGRNLLLREETEDGKVICFSYLPNTNLVTSKLTKDADKSLLREFYVYDDCNNLIQSISDDGATENKDDLSQVTQRRLITYTLRQAAPFLHMPEWIEETYWENGTEKPLKKSHLIYDQHGNVAQEEVYGADGQHAYTICKTYNERGDVLTETNRLGQDATYAYDPRGRLETSLNFSHRLHTTLRYDSKSRLKAKTEKGDDGVTHEVFSEYDFFGRRTQKTDSFHNTTHYAYDPLVNEISKTDFPLIASIDGQAIPVSTFSTYDPFGRELTKTDANGNTTSYRYNAYGSPTEIIHSNGGKEVFRYEKNGQLNSHTDLDGLTAYYKRDVLGRTLLKTYVSIDGKTLAQEAFTHNGFNLLAETDKEGNVKQFSYDGAGRKTREEFSGQVTDYHYDALGWLVTICQHNSDNTLLTHYKRDLEGRVLEELKTDTYYNNLYRITYSYDEDGNKKSVTRYIHGKEAVSGFAYDPFQRLVEKRDAEGYETKTIYNEDHTNTLGQKVLQIATTDPRQVTTIETKDALSRETKKETLDPQKTAIACQVMTYDPHGNLLYRRDHVYENGQYQNTQTIQYTYTSDHQVASLTRAFGTQDSRTTTFTRLPSGKMATKTLPDGVTLAYSYHPLGFLGRIDSSDGKICHAFDYDLLGRLTYAIDEKQDIAISRQVDPLGNVTQETFPNNLEVQKAYDNFSRLTSLKMGSQGEVFYVYDPLFLRKVLRTSSRGETLYEHRYEDYDEDGNLVTERLIGSLGDVTYAFDPRGHKRSISSPYFSQQCQYDPTGNLVNSIVDGAETRYSYDGLSQLCSENSISQPLTYVHDSLYNRTQKNGKAHEVNDLNELISTENARCSYDRNGNQILRATPSETFHLTYDPLNQLIEALSETQRISFTYDPLGRRLSKTVYTLAAHGWRESEHEYYLYDDQNEIGSFAAPDNPKNLRVLGLAMHKDNPATVGIEVGSKLFAPLLDVQGNIRRLVDLDTKSMAESYNFTAFGEATQEDLQCDSPWRYASKRFDPELGLIYFGKRYYDPRLGRWITTDPAGFVDSFNLYQYVLNNPFRFYDPRGESLGGYLLGLGEIICGSALMIAGGVIEIGSFGTLTVGFALAESAGAALIGHGLSLTAEHAKDIKAPNISWKNTDVYVPDRPLPNTPDGVHVPDTDAPHTQLGTKEGRKGKYPQAREFDQHGHPVRDIDFTDHERPQNHPNPHQHEHKPNPTGGTPTRDPKGQPVTGWKYS
jgi:RHS repeat-associated protein